VPQSEWTETQLLDGWIFRPAIRPPDVLIGFSGRGVAPPGFASPTELLARRFATALEAESLAIVRATQVHGRTATLVREAPLDGRTRDAGECDVLATALTGVALVVQTADCVPILLRAGGSVAAAHAGWRGSAVEAARAAVGALEELGARADEVEAWIGPSIGACCYEVGDDVAARFGGEFLRSGRRGRVHLNLAAANRAQLEAAGVPPEAISVHPACTNCGGERFASYRRDGAGAGRMIGLIARIASSKRRDGNWN
jgi:polyphenol oxidase